MRGEKAQRFFKISSAYPSFYVVIHPYLLCVESCGEPIVIFIWLLIFSALMCCLYSFGVRCISECLWNGRLNSVYVMWMHVVCTLCTIFLSSITIFSASVNILYDNAKIVYVIIKKKVVTLHFQDNRSQKSGFLKHNN